MAFLEEPSNVFVVNTIAWVQHLCGLFLDSKEPNFFRGLLAHLYRIRLLSCILLFSGFFQNNDSGFASF